jgi:superfamily I DNA and/or RNA helicase
MRLEDHVAALVRLLELERAEEVRRFELEQSGLSPEARQERGHAIVGLVAVETRSLAGRVLAHLAPSREGAQIPSSQIGAGSIVRVSLRRGEEEPVTGVVSRLSRATLAVAFDGAPPLWLDDGSLVLELVPSAVTYERQRAGLSRLLQGSERHLEKWRALLTGIRAPTFRGSGEFFSSEPLNPEQREAVRLSLTADDLALVHGPPGTGKTTVLAEVVLSAVARGERVLASAASNTAVDNLLARVAGRGVKGVRLGHVARVDEALIPYTLDEQLEASEAKGIARELLDEAHALLAKARKLASRGRSAERFQEAREARSQASRRFAEARERLRGVRAQIVQRAQVVFATCTGAQAEVLDGERFDLAVIDEATQATEPSALLALLRARKAVLAGDPAQLPPTVLSQEAARGGLARSLFERLLSTHGPGVARMLREQHRMHAQIMAFPSRELYGSELRAHPRVAGHTLDELPGVNAGRPPLSFIDTAGKGFEDEAGEDGESRRNPLEAALVAREVQALLSSGLSPAQVSVIAPYDAQVQTLRALLPFPDLEVDTVDGFQGRENEAVVVSLTRSNPNGEVGFLADIRRMNVAITRARRHLLVVGDSATVSSHPFYRRFVDHVTLCGGYVSAWELGE